MMTHGPSGGGPWNGEDFVLDDEAPYVSPSRCEICGRRFDGVSRYRRVIEVAGGHLREAVCCLRCATGHDEPEPPGLAGPPPS